MIVKTQRTGLIQALNSTPDFIIKTEPWVNVTAAGGWCSALNLAKFITGYLVQLVRVETFKLREFYIVISNLWN